MGGCIVRGSFTSHSEGLINSKSTHLNLKTMILVSNVQSRVGHRDANDNTCHLNLTGESGVQTGS
jgi:hypothetical protein